jgi:anti-anti-sigma regulatory factor
VDSTGQAVLRIPNAGMMDVLGDLDRRLESLLESGPRTLVVDLSAVVRLSSTTIAALLWVGRRCSARGVEVVLSDASRRHVAMLQRIGLRHAPAPASMTMWAPLTGRRPRRSR